MSSIAQYFYNMLCTENYTTLAIAKIQRQTQQVSLLWYLSCTKKLVFYMSYVYFIIILVKFWWYVHRDTCTLPVCTLPVYTLPVCTFLCGLLPPRSAEYYSIFFNFKSGTNGPARLLMFFSMEMKANPYLRMIVSKCVSVKYILAMFTDRCF